MALCHLSIEGFRNLEPGEFDFSPGLNLVTGANAAGKTSLLEAIHFLSRARSFRTHQTEQLIQEGAEAFQLVGRVERAGSGLVTVGIRRTRSEQSIRLAGETVRRVSDLAALFPELVLTSDQHKVLEEGPKYRRQFLDWGLFHVEHSFHSLWFQYRASLKQRNAALRTGASPGQIAAWDPTLIETAEAIHQQRTAYLEQLTPLFQDQVAALLDIPNPLIRYQPGWPRKHSFAESLQSGLERDRALGFTRTGPHRADLQFTSDNRDLRDRLSRGQQKQLITALHLAQATLLWDQHRQRCRFLIDDLPAELDARHQARVLGQLQALGAQVFVSAIDPDVVSLAGWNDGRWFHVEHGTVTQK